ncbi:MAG: hypothetical protein QOD12_506 [Verrucomicrobiota bacterium]
MKSSPKIESLADRVIALRKSVVLALLFYLAPGVSADAELSPAEKARLASLNKKVGELYQAGKFGEAISLTQEGVALAEKALGPTHSETASLLNNLAVLYKSTGEYAKAEPLLQRVLKIDEQTLGPDNPKTATSLNNLADLYSAMGHYAKAEALFQRTMKMQEKALGPDHPDTAVILSNLGALYYTMGDYAKAEPLMQRALKITEKAVGLDDIATATALSDLALLHETMGDYAKAEPLYQRALKIREKAFGPDHPNTAALLSNMALLYYSMRDFDKAESLYVRALKIQEKELGPEHSDTVTTMSNLALLYDFTGEYAEAATLGHRTLTITEKKFGPDHPNTATSLVNLAETYRGLGNHEKAEPLYERALKIYTRTLGLEHPDAARILGNLAFLKIDTGKLNEALPLVVRSRQAREKYLSNILSFTSEQQRLAFQQTTNPYSLPATIGDGDEVAETILRQKGVVLDSLLEDRLVAEASSDPKQRAVIEQLRAAKQRLTQLTLDVSKSLSEPQQKERMAEREKLAAEVEQLEAGLARQVAGLGKARRALSVKVGHVQAVLPRETVLVELLRYQHYLGKRKFELRYGAVVVAADAASKWIPLGSASEIEKEVKRYQKSVRGQTNQTVLASALKSLHEKVWTPLTKAFPEGTKTVIISPDAELSFVSFTTLIAADDRFAGEKYSIRYVASGRDLLRDLKPAEEKKTTMRVFANPDFAATAVKLAEHNANAIAFRSAEMRDLQALSLPDLPGTEKESAALEARAKQLNWKSEVTAGPKATEAELRKINSPRILHLATHGFFLPEIDLGPAETAPGPAREMTKGKLVNPMHRSGLAVAGAQTTLQAWRRGEAPPTENDGIITAEEVGGLNLERTWLVTLSACDTGSGEAKAGEGVMGLRRGFIQSGAQNLLMTLWPISDETTVQIMLDFYDVALKSGNAPQALSDTQRDWLVKLRNERGLLWAVRLAGPFIMSSQGKP